MRNTRRKQINKVREYEKQGKAFHEYIEDEFLEDGKAVIYINLEELDTIYHPLSYGQQRELSVDIYDYIDSKTYYIPARYPVKILFLKGCLDLNQKEQIAHLLKEHYTAILQDKRMDLKINTMKIIGLTVLGVLLLGLYFLLELTDQRQLFMEFLSIAGTFSLWEAVDFYLLERKQIQSEWLNAGQSALCEINFIKIDISEE